MTEPAITYRIEDDVALIGLNRPEKRNALNRDMISRLSDAFLRAGDEARVGVIHSSGPNFSSGLDLAELASGAVSDPANGDKKFRNPWHTAFDVLARGPIPFVAALNGAVLGGGLELASATHIRVAEESAYFGLPEAQRGIFVGGGGTVRIQRIVGNATMTDLMLTGRTMNAAEAAAIRLVQYVTPSEGALAKAMELARKIATNAPQSNWAITNVLPRVNDLSHDDGLFMEYLVSANISSAESMERLRAFLDKRVPRIVDQTEGGARRE